MIKKRTYKIWAAAFAGTLLLCACQPTELTYDSTSRGKSESSVIFAESSDDNSGESSDEMSAESSDETSAESSGGEIPVENQDAAAAILSEMTLREKVGQLFVVRPEALEEPSRDLNKNYPTVDGFSERARENLAEYPVGGVALFAANTTSPESTAAFTKALSEAGKIPLYIAVDEEGGRVARLANNDSFSLPKYESAAAVGASGNPADAYEMGKTIGTYLKEYGFNMDFAPDADVNTNPDNPVIGDRAFSSDPDTAAKMAASMANGLRESGIIPVFKHFPGHGDTSEDSHSGAAFVDKTAAEMAECEWLPFEGATDADGIMVGHITVPAIDGAPASLSEKVVSGILRDKLGFDGIVITDALAMGAVVDGYGTGEACVLAIEAGCDILLMPDVLSEGFEAVLDAVQSGRISESRLDRSVLRILRSKLESGILNPHQSA